jgi:polysaccharide biosynthesis transport protein
MSSLTPLPPNNPGFQVGAPVDVNTAPPPPKFRLKKFLFFLRKFWWIPVITLVLALIAGVIDFLETPPLFVSRASMWETEKLQLPDGASFAQDQDTYFGTLTAVLQSEPLREMALSRLQTNQIAVDQNENPLGVSINVYQAPKSSVFIVEADSANPNFTQVYLDALLGSYLDYKKTVRKDVSDDTLASISTQINILQDDMNNGETNLTRYEESNNLAVLEQENEVGGSELAKLKGLLADDLLKSNTLDAVELERTIAPIGPILNTTNMANPLFSQVAGDNQSGSPVSASENAIQQIESLKFERTRLSKYLRPTHPKIVKLDEDITNAQNLVDFYRRQNDQDIAVARKALKIEMDSITNAIYQWEIRVKYDSGLISEANNLKENIQRNQTMFDRLTSLLDNVDITRNIDQDPLAILEHASGATRSYGKLKSNLSTACIGGLAIGLGIVFLITIRDDRFSSVIEVAERIGDHVVGQVPEMPASNGAPLALLADNDERHMYVESYRNLRSALLYFAVDGVRPKVLLITSAVPNEGKSTIASNLSLIMALGGARVLLIDADLRKGRLHDLLGVKSKPGLAELLLEPNNIDKFIQETAMPNLWFIARGSGPRNPGDLFLNNAIDGILAVLRERFDYIIVDSSPVFAADDSTTLAPKMDGTLFVVRSHFSRSNMVKEALELLYQRQATVLGLILNRTDATGRSYHYYKYSEYHSTTETQ